MSNRVPPEVLQVQSEASDPGVSAWVSANAGSGKTHVLTQRVIRLMLHGADPDKILCLTFTRAAAANMANRIYQTLSAWIELDDAQLDAAIRSIDGRTPTPALRLRARRLFAEALDTPGGLKVQTIHAFCTRLLHQFPFEAGVAARFTVLEERAQAELIDKTRFGVLLEAAAAPDATLGRALATAIALSSDFTFGEAVREAIDRRDAVTAWIDHAGGVAAVTAQLEHALDIAAGETAEKIEEEILSSAILSAPLWREVVAALLTGGPNDAKLADYLTLAAEAAGRARLDPYLSIFCTDDRKPRKKLVSKGVQAVNPALAEQLIAEQGRVCALLDRLRAVRARDRTAALLTIVDAVLRRYEAEKQRRALLDYDDLIEKTLGLFTKVSATWVLYKLDRGIDHVLIDEAQDTSPKQWDVIAKLVAEFAAGEGARSSVKRTIFAVGDEKQSIFSFQGAAPHKFAEMRRHFEALFGDAGRPLRPIRFEPSFRSTPDVLAAVDTVFSREQAYAGLTADPIKTVHRAVRETAPGFVEVWPIIEAEARADIEGWDAPFDTRSETSPPVLLARRIARTVRHWLDRRERLPMTNEAIRPGDVLVLVRQRGPVFEALLRALKEAGVPVAGADRLSLTEHIAVMDLMVLADALLCPADDLALATALKSPLFGLDEDQLFRIAWGRKGSLRAALRASVGDDPRFVAASARLDSLAEAARRQTPFAFYAALLGAGGGRAKMLARLGPEAIDALDEFLACALAYESRETPSLQGFIAWLRATVTDVKRDMDIVRDEVRVMTVHGAKGLEAPIVILADTTTRPAGPRPPLLLPIPPVAAPPGTPDRLVWAASKVTDGELLAEPRERERRAAEDEYRRLLYVAMTRAADRLVICGTQGLVKRPEGCWYDLVCDALQADAAPESADIGDGEVLRWRKSPAAAPDIAPPKRGSQTALDLLPSWLTTVVAADSGRRASLAPSGAVAAAPPPFAAQASEAARRARVRGRLVHRLLQALPDLAPERRADAARRFALQAGMADAERDAVVAEVLAVLAAEATASLFAPGSRAEVPIVGRIERTAEQPLLVSGQIDRLAVTADAVWIADYKTSRIVPAELKDVPAAYVTQLALYRAVLGRIYPEREVRAAIVWTEGPRVTEIPAPLLDDAIAGLP